MLIIVNGYFYFFLLQAEFKNREKHQSITAGTEYGNTPIIPVTKCQLDLSQQFRSNNLPAYYLVSVKTKMMEKILSRCQ